MHSILHRCVARTVPMQTHHQLQPRFILACRLGWDLLASIASQIPQGPFFARGFAKVFVPMTHGSGFEADGVRRGGARDRRRV
jgi:hypothetical protein